MKSSCGQGARKNAGEKNLHSPLVVRIYAQWITIAIAIFVHLYISFVPSRVWEAWRVLAVSCCGHHQLLLCFSSHNQTRSNQTFSSFRILCFVCFFKIMGIVIIHLLWSETSLELKNPPHQRLFSWQSRLLSEQSARMGVVGLELCEVLVQRSSVVLVCLILATCPQHRRRICSVFLLFISEKWDYSLGNTILICVTLKCSFLHCLSFVWQTFQYIHLLTESWQPELLIFCAALFNWHELVSLPKVWHSHKLGSTLFLLHLLQLNTSEQIDLRIFEQRFTKNLGKEELVVV